MRKIVHIGKGNNGDVFCKIKFDPAKHSLSITGVEGPKRNGNALGSFGQIIMHEWGIKTYAAGWDAALEAKFRAVWDRWHLNDMRAGSPAQMAFLEANPVEGHHNYYARACQALEAAGLNPDSGHLVNGKPYHYGSLWLKEEVSDEVLEFLGSLPESQLTPAWV